MVVNINNDASIYNNYILLIIKSRVHSKSWNNQSVNQKTSLPQQVSISLYHVVS